MIDLNCRTAREWLANYRDLAPLEAHRTAGNVAPPHPGPPLTDQGEGLVPVGFQVTQPSAQGSSIVFA